MTDVTTAAARNPAAQELDTSPAGRALPLPARCRHVLCLDDFEAAARRHLPASVFAYVATAVETNQSFRANRSSYEGYEFVPRTLVDISQRSTATTLFGRNYAAPFGIAPMGICALSAYRGDIVLARGALAENIPMVVSGASLIRLEDIAQANPHAWFQAYLPGDEAKIVALLERASLAGYRTLVITVDTASPSNRENMARAGFSTPLRPSVQLAWQGLTHPAWLFGTLLRTLVRHGMPHFENTYAHRGAPMISPTAERVMNDRGFLNWRHLERVRRLWQGQLVIKGVLDVRDAQRAVAAGVDGIIVSNHGGRQLDGAVAPLRVLPQIVAACPEVPVMIDSGIRRGSDVLKALALGARFVFVGRPFSFAAAVGGEAGVRRAAELLKMEISRNMAMLGVTALDQIDATFLMKSE